MKVKRQMKNWTKIFNKEMIDIWNKNLNKLMCLQKLIETWTKTWTGNSKIENYKHEK